jgi:aryl-alcohol dehydrogenase-like predicted oxidoreductase
MKRRRFGQTDLEVSIFGFGCARIGGIFQGDTAGYLRLLDAARDAGITFFDTADMYSQGESEALLGRAFRSQRARVVIASKVGYCLPARRKLVARLKPLVKPLIARLGLRRDQLPGAARGAVTQDFSPGYLARAVTASLKRLRTDYLDLLQLHSPPADIVKRGDFVEALETMKKKGMLRYYGIACDDTEAGLAALEYRGVSSLQCTVNLLNRTAAEDLVPRAAERGVGCIARECLANGLLVKAPGELDLTKFFPSPHECELKTRTLEALRRDAADRHVALSSLALTYASELPGVSVALIGARTTEQLTGVLRAAGV